MKSTYVSSRLSEEDLLSIRDSIHNKSCSDDDKKRLIRDMAYHHCSWPEIGSSVGISRQHLEEKYRDVLNEAQSDFKYDLRRSQFNSATANKGNPAMLIWLGKQYLEQTEAPQMEIKKDQFDQFIEWISSQKQLSSLPALNKSEVY